MSMTIEKLTRLNGVAGQFSIVAAVIYEGEPVSHVEFVGNESGTPGPVVMISASGVQTFVTEPGRFGATFGPEWVRRFFA